MGLTARSSHPPKSPPTEFSLAVNYRQSTTGEPIQRIANSAISDEQNTMLAASTRWFMLLLTVSILNGILAPNAYGFNGQDSIEVVLAKNCLECHSGTNAEAGLDLSQSAGLAAGGESGPAVNDQSPLESLIWQRIADGSMPPKKKLDEKSIAILRQWIETSRALPTKPIDRFRITTDSRAGYDWWSLQLIQSPSVPSAPSGYTTETPVDAFIASKLSQANIRQSAAASPRSLIRRVYYDLIGLPPSFEAVTAFEADPSDANYEKIVDELLESPQYGEHWARHWLDVVRFGESDGFERNYPRYNSWPYRDWVIASFNRDLPYDEFVRKQLVGDLEGTPEGFAAAGFLVAGIHNTVVGSSDRMKRIAIQDELEEVIGTISQSFLGLTAQCARCHDHKFDPIPLKTYYQMASSIQGVGHGEVEIERPEVAKQIATLRRELDKAKEQLRLIRSAQIGKLSTGSEQVPAPESAKLASRLPVYHWSFTDSAAEDSGALQAKIHGNASVVDGALVCDGASYVETDPLPHAFREKSFAVWVQLDSLEQSGGGIATLQVPGKDLFDSLVFAEREPARWMAGSNGFSRYQSFGASPEDLAAVKPVHLVLTYAEDGTIRAFRNGVPYGNAYRSSGLLPFDSGNAKVLFGIRHEPAGGNRHFKGKILDASLYDVALTEDDVAAIASSSDPVLSEQAFVQSLPDESRKIYVAASQTVLDLNVKVRELVAHSRDKLYSVRPNNSPGVTKILRRGDVYAEGDIVSAGAIDALPHQKADFGLEPNASDANRRMALANWISDRNNPLLARVMVNRLWHYHFGVGIVDTPSDFGFNGGRPSHPELLEWLSSQLIANNFQIKPLHRLIMRSHTYRQSTDYNPDAAATDTSNRLLWRYTPKRLDAEQVRDSMLAVSRKLNPAIGGPGFRDVEVREFNGTTYYVPKEVDSADYYRRTIYRFNPRCERAPILDAFDCPDPSATAPKRSVTTTPLQALSLLNNPFVLAISAHARTNALREHPENQSAQIRYLWQQILMRSPDEHEFRVSEKLVLEHGLEALCRALLNTTEFVVVD